MTGPSVKHPRFSLAGRSTALVLALCGGWAVLPSWAHAHRADATGGIGGTGIGPGRAPVMTPAGGETGGIGGTGIGPGRAPVMTPAGGETGGIGGTGIGPANARIVGYGPIQRFGSVFVNGREYALTGQTLVTIDGSAATVAALRIGDIAQVRGFTTGPHRGLALSISVRDAIIGPVSAVAHHGTAFTVLGQRVVAATAGKPFMALKPGEMVAVSAQRQADGNWAAQRVSVHPADNRFRLEAKVSAVEPGVIVVAGTTIAAPKALIAGVQPGDRVAVSGTIKGAHLQATDVIRRPIALGAPGTRIEVQNYFRSAGVGRIVAADGMVATGALPKAPLSGLKSVMIDGQITAPNTIAIQHIDIDEAVAPDLAGVGAQRADSVGALETQEPGGDVAEPQTNSDGEVAPPDDVGAPVDIEPPEVNEPSAPTPDVEPPEITPPHVEDPTSQVEPPEIDTPSDK